MKANLTNKQILNLLDKERKKSEKLIEGINSFLPNVSAQDEFYYREVLESMISSLENNIELSNLVKKELINKDDVKNNEEEYDEVALDVSEVEILNQEYKEIFKLLLNAKSQNIKPKSSKDLESLTLNLKNGDEILDTIRMLGRSGEMALGDHEDEDEHDVAGEEEHLQQVRSLMNSLNLTDHNSEELISEVLLDVFPYPGSFQVIQYVLEKELEESGRLPSKEEDKARELTLLIELAKPALEKGISIDLFLQKFLGPAKERLEKNKSESPRQFFDSFSQLLDYINLKSEPFLVQTILRNYSTGKNLEQIQNAVQMIEEKGPQGNVLQFKRKALITQELIKLADDLDRKNLSNEADLVDKLIKILNKG